jgi:hypothetical protein
LGVVSRVGARAAALTVAQGGAQWVLGAGDDGVGAADVESVLGLGRIHAAQAGLLGDMDRVADALYGRRP